MNTDRLRKQIVFLQHAVNRLANTLDQPKNEYLRGAAIQRFEFTFELAWKVMKTYAESQGLEAALRVNPYEWHSRRLSFLKISASSL